MNFLSSRVINRIFDVELHKDLSTCLTPIKLQKELTNSVDKKKSPFVSKKIELVQHFTVTKNLKEIYDTVLKFHLFIEEFNFNK